MKARNVIEFIFINLISTLANAQPRVGITGGMNLSVLTGTVNMETGFKPGITLGGVVDIPVFHHPLTT